MFQILHGPYLYQNFFFHVGCPVFYLLNLANLPERYLESERVQIPLKRARRQES